MTTPTLEQQEEMARRAGLKDVHTNPEGVTLHRERSQVGRIGWKWSKLPDFTDLSTLFRYVIIPKQINYRLESFQDEHLATVWIGEFLSEDSAFVGDESPGLAMFWACYKLLKEEEDGRE